MTYDAKIKIYNVVYYQLCHCDSKTIVIVFTLQLYLTVVKFYVNMAVSYYIVFVTYHYYHASDSHAT